VHGAAITQAAGFTTPSETQEAAGHRGTIGDSTFFHAGSGPDRCRGAAGEVHAGLLDNRTTAMTGNQPTPASGFGLAASPWTSWTGIARARLRVKFCAWGTLSLKELIGLMKERWLQPRERPGGVIARHPAFSTGRARAQAASSLP